MIQVVAHYQLLFFPVNVFQDEAGHPTFEFRNSSPGLLLYDSYRRRRYQVVEDPDGHLTLTPKHPYFPGKQ